MTKFTSKLSFFIALSGFSATLSYAQNVEYIDYADAVGLVHNVQLRVLDNVSDGCWTNSSAVENRVTAKLEQSGIRTYSEDLAFLNGFSVLLYIEPNGYRTASGLCVGALTYDVSASVNQSFGNLESMGQTWGVSRIANLYSNGAVFSGPNNLNTEVLDFVDSFTDEIITLIHKGRRSDGVKRLIDNMPNLTHEAMTQAEWDQMIRNAMESRD